MNNRNILFLIITLNTGGAEHVLVNIANRMAEDGFAVTVQTLLDEGEYRKKLSQKVTYKGGFHTSSTLIRRIVMKLFYILPAKVLGRLLIGKGYSHIVAFLEGLPTKIIYGCRGHGAKKIAWVHTDLYHNQSAKGSFGTSGRTLGAYQAFDQVLCVSNDAKEGFLRQVGEHRAIDVQYNPLDKGEILQKAQEEPAYYVSKAEAFRMVAVGRLNSVKGFDLLLEAMARVKNEASMPVELYIIGGGAEEAALRDTILRLQLQNVVFLCGQQTNPYSIMRQCDMQVISSRAEGYPLALCEGHFLGLPVVSTRCTGPLEILGASGGGILVDISAEGLAEGILTMINEPAVFGQCRKNAKTWAESYDADALYRQIENRFS